MKSKKYDISYDTTQNMISSLCENKLLNNSFENN